MGQAMGQVMRRAILPMPPSGRAACPPAKIIARIAPAYPDWGLLRRPLVFDGRTYSWSRAGRGKSAIWNLLPADGPLAIARVRCLGSWRYRAEVALQREGAATLVCARTFGNICGAKLWAATAIAEAAD